MTFFAAIGVVASAFLLLVAAWLLVVPTTVILKWSYKAEDVPSFLPSIRPFVTEQTETREE